jgi:predicted membrane protein
MISSWKWIVSLLLLLVQVVSCHQTQTIGTVEIITILLIIFGVLSVLFLILSIGICIALIFIIPRLLKYYEEGKLK